MMVHPIYWGFHNHGLSMRPNPKPLPRPTAADIERFYNRCRHEGMCVIWTNKTPRFFYSHLSVRPARFLYMVLNGDPGHVALIRTCKTPECILHTQPSTNAYAT